MTTSAWFHLCVPSFWALIWFLIHQKGQGVWTYGLTGVILVPQANECYLIHCLASSRASSGLKGSNVATSVSKLYLSMCMSCCRQMRIGSTLVRSWDGGLKIAWITSSHSRRRRTSKSPRTRCYSISSGCVPWAGTCWPPMRSELCTAGGASCLRLLKYSCQRTLPTSAKRSRLEGRSKLRIFVRGTKQWRSQGVPGDWLSDATFRSWIMLKEFGRLLLWTKVHVVTEAVL